MDDEYLQPVISSQGQEYFQKLETIPVILIPFILSVTLEMTGIILVFFWPKGEDKCQTHSILLYLHCFYWFVVMVTDYILKQKHHYLRISGYLEFYQSTYQYIRAPLFIASLWNTFYLLLVVISHQIHEVDYEEYCRASGWFTPLNYILVLTTFENFIVIPVYVNYIRKVYRFNNLEPPSDVTREEWMISFTQDSYASSSGIGFQQRDSRVTELLEKQADLIRYLKDHNIELSHRLMLSASQRGTLQL